MLVACIKLFINSQYKYSIEVMLSSPRNIRSTLSLPPNYHKIASLRSKLKEWPEIAEEMESMVECLMGSIETQGKTITALESYIKSILSNLKQAHSHPSQWLQSLKVKERQTSPLFDAKLSQFEQIYQAITCNSIMIDSINSISSTKETSLNIKELPIPNSKKQALAFYKEAVQYYRWKQRGTTFKDIYQISMEQVVKNNPELSQSSQFRQQVQERAKMRGIMDKIGSRFAGLEKKLLGFSLQKSKVINLEDIEAKLSKLQVYINQSHQPKSSEKVTPKNVKQHSTIVNILTTIANSNSGLLQQSLGSIQEPIRTICTRILQNITKNNKSIQGLYEFLLEKMDERSAFKYARSVRQLPLDKKIGECERLVKEVKQSLGSFSCKPNQAVSKQAKLQQQHILQALNSKIMDGENRLLLAEEHIYALEAKCQSIQGQNKQLKARIEQLSQTIQVEKQRYINMQNGLKANQERILVKNRQLTSQFQAIKLANHSISEQLVQQQHEIMEKDEHILQLNHIVQEFEWQIQAQPPKKQRKLTLHPNTIQHRLLPQGMQQVISLIQDANLMSSEPASPLRLHKRQRFGIKHSRSLSNVDFLSQLMPDMIQRELQNESLSGTADLEQLRKGIQLRQKTIKKYEVYMDKQRKEAKRHRAEILDLQAKVRALELQNIRLKQEVQDHSSQKLLQLDGECGSLVQVVEQCEEISSIEKIAEKEVELKVKEEEINFKIEEIIKHVLKLNTLRVSPQGDSECAEEGTETSPEASTTFIHH